MNSNCWREKNQIETSQHSSHARTVRRIQDSGGGGTPPPSVQFKLYQGEVLQYKSGDSDPRCDRMDLALVQIDLYQGLGGIHPVRDS